MVTVKQLKKVLEAYEDDTIVVLQRDSEGNGYSPMAGLWPGTYVPDTRYYGDMYDEEELDNYEDLSLYARENDGKPAVCFYPLS